MISDRFIFDLADLLEKRIQVVLKAANVRYPSFNKLDIKVETITKLAAAMNLDIELVVKDNRTNQIYFQPNSKIQLKQPRPSQNLNKEELLKLSDTLNKLINEKLI